MKQSKITDYFASNFTNKHKMKQSKITHYFTKKRIYGYNSITGSWHCTICGIDMGRNNPRQLCRKSWCDSAGLGSRSWQPVLAAGLGRRPLM